MFGQTIQAIYTNGNWKALIIRRKTSAISGNCKRIRNHHKYTFKLPASTKILNPYQLDFDLTNKKVDESVIK